MAKENMVEQIALYQIEGLEKKPIEKGTIFACPEDELASLQESGSCRDLYPEGEEPAEEDSRSSEGEHVDSLAKMVSERDSRIAELEVTLKERDAWIAELEAEKADAIKAFIQPAGEVDKVL